MKSLEKQVFQVVRIRLDPLNLLILSTQNLETLLIKTKK